MCDQRCRRRVEGRPKRIEAAARLVHQRAPLVSCHRIQKAVGCLGQCRAAMSFVFTRAGSLRGEEFGRGASSVVGGAAFFPSPRPRRSLVTVARPRQLFAELGRAVVRPCGVTQENSPRQRKRQRQKACPWSLFAGWVAGLLGARFVGVAWLQRIRSTSAKRNGRPLVSTGRRWLRTLSTVACCLCHGVGEMEQGTQEIRMPAEVRQSCR